HRNDTKGSGEQATAFPENFPLTGLYGSLTVILFCLQPDREQAIIPAKSNDDNKDTFILN
ncbi:MAG: hypothetical protein LBR10_02310, partial [Prevotellaceae bacterium]|nr:hypothetical protein [Prevotellaceae bacterium]